MRWRNVHNWQSCSLGDEMPQTECFPSELIRRIRREYLETPGLSLTLPQVQRLFTADRERCVLAVGALIDGGLLYREGGQFVRVHPASMSRGAAMVARAAPWDCHWAEPVLIAPAPVWLEALCGSWACLRNGGPRALDARDCLACPRWEPRLATRRSERRTHSSLTPDRSDSRSSSR